MSRQDDARVLLAAAEIKEMLKSIEAQRQQFANLHGDQLLPDGSIPITFTKVVTTNSDPVTYLLIIMCEIF